MKGQTLTELTSSSLSQAEGDEIRLHTHITIDKGLRLYSWWSQSKTIQSLLWVSIVYETRTFELQFFRALDIFISDILHGFAKKKWKKKKKEEKRQKWNERKKKQYTNCLGFTGFHLSRSNKSLRSSWYNRKYNELGVILFKIHSSPFLVYENQRSMGSLILQNHCSFLR